MTTAGLQVWNSADFLQIDDTYSNLVLRQKGTIAQGGGAVVYPGGVTPILVLFPILGPDVHCATPNGLDVSGSTYTWSVTAACDYYVFDVAPAPPAHGVGLQVFNASSNLMYDSAFAPLRIVTSINHTPPNATPADQSVQIATLPAATKVGWIQSASAFYREDRPVGGGLTWQAVGQEGLHKNLGQTEVFARKTDFVFTGGSASLIQHFTGTHIGVDVTGL